MFRFNYNYTDYESLMRDLAGRLKVTISDNRIEFPVHFAEGYCYFIKLPNGVHANVIAAHLHTDVMLYRTPVEAEYYTLRFDEFVSPGRMSISIGDSRSEEENTSQAIAYLTSSRFNWSMFASAGTVFNSVNILFSREWLAKYLGLQTVEECLPQYLKMSALRFNNEVLDSEYKRLLKEITEVDEAHPIRLAYLQNRILLLIERFFTRLISRLKDNAEDGLPTEDINRMMELEKELTRDLFRKPPTIAALAKMLTISETKLKKDFKKLFGMPPYEYYQKARMQAAREQLLSGNYSVKQVALSLGYANLSNFSIAFRKQFGLLPSQVLEK
ncbi:MAG TPA: helix-turn-helix transcriptional regulator [Chitinophagaceae bacterium]|nr:helix-turn-helix transcriptional regulator [Chitinophagaceae bacterium]